MKMLLIMAFAMTSMLAFAEGDAKEGFEMRKSKALENVEKRIAGMNELKSCISDAADKAALKECRKAHKGKMKEMKKMRKDKRKAKKKDKK